MSQPDPQSEIHEQFEEEIAQAKADQTKKIIAEIRGELAQYTQMDSEDIRQFDKYLKTLNSSK